MSLTPGSFWKFSAELESTVNNLCENLKSETCDNSRMWFELCTKPDELEMIVEANSTDSNSIDETVKDILNMIDRHSIQEHFGISSRSEECQQRICNALQTELISSQISALCCDLKTWREGTVTECVYTEVLLPQIISERVPISILEELALAHPRIVGHIFPEIFNTLYKNEESIVTVFKGLPSSERSILLRKFLKHPLQEDKLALLQQLLPFTPADSLIPASEALIKSCEPYSDSLPFARFLLNICNLHSSTMAPQARQNLLKVCESNRTLLKRQIVRKLED